MIRDVNYRNVWYSFNPSRMEKCLLYKNNRISLLELSQCLNVKKNIAQAVANVVFNYIKTSIDNELEDGIYEELDAETMRSEYKVERIVD